MAMIRATMARFFLRAMVARGYPAEALLRGTDLTQGQLVAPTQGIEPLQLRRLVQNMIDVCGEPELGLELGAQLTIGDLGILGHALLSCETIGEVSPLWDRYNELIGTLIRNESTIDAKTWRIEFRELLPLGPLASFFHQHHFAATRTLSNVLPQRPLQFREVLVAGAGPAGARSWERYFGCPVRFNASCNAILMDASQLAASLATADSEAFSLTVEHCRQMLSRLEEQSGGLESRIRHELAACRSRTPRLPEVAARLGMSERSLHRHLQGEGLRFTDILARHRRDLCFEYLRHTALSPKEVGYLLGFDNTSSFRRAFKEWTGLTVGDFLDKEGLGRTRAA